MPAIRKLDWVAVEQIVAGKAAGWSDRQIAAALGVSHTTVSRRIRRDIELRVRISAAKKRGARRARDRERKVRAKARREAGLEPASPPEQGERSLARPSPGGVQELGDRAPPSAQDAAHSRPGDDSTPHPGPVRRDGRRGGRILRPVAIGASSDPTPRWWLERRKLVPAAELHPDLVWMHREGENQNFEPDEVAAALADGWRPHE